MSKARVLVIILAFSAPAVWAQLTLEKNETRYVQEEQENRPADTFKTLRLNDVLEQGLRQNYFERMRQTQKEILDLEFADTKEEFWWPSLKLKMEHTPYRVGRLRSGSMNGGNSTTSPEGTFGLELGEYTVFNWGKDHLVYLNERTTYARQKESLNEERRELKHQLIIAFFQVKSLKEIEKAKRDQLRHSSFIYRLNREKINLKKISSQAYYQARAEYLRAQNEYQDARTSLLLAEENLAYAIQDNVGTRYFFPEELRFERLKTSLDEAARFAAEQSPNVLEARSQVEKTQRDYDRIQRENLPLPKFSVNLGAYNHNFGNATGGHTRFETAPGDSNIDLVATLTATWSITGPGGLFNGRKNRLGLLDRYQAGIDLSRAQHEMKSYVRNLYQEILNNERQITVLEARVPNLLKTFDTVMENYMNTRASFNDFKDTLRELTDATVLLSFTRAKHVENKILLANAMGLEDFPGENFERLAQDPSTTTTKPENKR